MIGELFEKPPARPFKPVSSVEDRDPNTIFEELDEYVLTEEIRKDLEEIVDRFIETRRTPTEETCCWIAGFFGSGKTVLVKVLGHTFANTEVVLKTGERYKVGEYFLGKHSFPQIYSTALGKQFKTKTLFANMLARDITEFPSVSLTVYRELLQESGFSSEPWIAEVELMLKKRGIWKNFLHFVEESEALPWKDVRDMATRARSIFARALCALDNKSYPNSSLAERSLDDVKNSFRITPSLVVERLLEKAEEQDPVGGRIVIILDEVGIYVGTDTDRLGDLNILAEEISRKGKGKIWLIVTSQEILEDYVRKVEQYRGQFDKIRDRFQIKITISPENVDTVVKKRLLQKKADPSKVGPLAELFRASSGILATSALLTKPSRDYHGLFTRLEELPFIESYPFMPYHIRLMQEIFNIMRYGRAPHGVTGARERAVLSVVRAILLGVKDRPPLTDSPLADMVTFDMVYDAIDEELKYIGSSERAAIESDIAQLGKRGDVKVESVAKCLFLLQSVEWVPRTVENIAALLYPAIGVEKSKLDNDVKDCLEVLKEQRWVDEIEGQYRFLRLIERSFERDVAQQEATPREIGELTQRLFQAIVKSDGLAVLEYKGIPVSVCVWVDDSEVPSATGHIELHLYSPYRAGSPSARGQLLEQVKLSSVAQPNVLYWVCEADQAFGRKVERVICTKKAIAARSLKATTDEENATLEEYRKKVSRIEEDDLPQLLRSTATTGTVIYQGQLTGLSGTRNIREVFQSEMARAAAEVFTQFDVAAYRLERDEDIGKILKWQRGELPKIYRDLQLLDARGNILTDRPVASNILLRLKSPKREERFGKALVEHFAAPPYGWDPRITRLVLAALFRNGTVAANYNGTQYLSPSETGSYEIFTRVHMFNRTEFERTEEALSHEQLEAASSVLLGVFGVKGGHTAEEIDTALKSILEDYRSTSKEAAIRTEEIGLPVSIALRGFAKNLEEIAAQASRSRRILSLAHKRQGLEETKPVFDKIKDFERRGNIERYRTIMKFSQYAAPQLASVLGDSELKEQVSSLQAGLSSPDFMDRWSDIGGVYEKLSRRYARLYVDIHAKRHELIVDVLKRLRSRPETRRLSEAKKREYFKPFEDLDCIVGEPKLDQFFKCDKCGSSLESISLELDSTIPREASKTEEEIGRYLAKETGEKEFKLLRPTEYTIKSKEDLPRVTRRIEEVSRAALKRRRAVRVRIGVE